MRQAGQIERRHCDGEVRPTLRGFPTQANRAGSPACGHVRRPETRARDRLTAFTNPARRFYRAWIERPCFQERERTDQLVLVSSSIPKVDGAYLDVVSRIEIEEWCNGKPWDHVKRRPTAQRKRSTHGLERD